MRRIRKERSGNNQWTRWMRPRMENYLMACCDCGLTHRMQFRVGIVTHGNAKTGAYRMRLLPDTEFRVMFRAQRAERYTALARKRRKP